MVLGGIVVAATVLYFYGQPRIVTLDHRKIDLSAEVYQLKAPSMKAWEDESISGMKISVFPYKRLATTIKGSWKVSIPHPRHEGLINVSVHMQGLGGLGAATVIGHDGYLLTAEHCIDVEPISVVIKEGGRKLKEVRARVVWKGKASTEREPDLALLHVDHAFTSVFTLGDAGGLSLRSPVFASGYSHFNEATCAGVVIRAPTAHASDSGVGWTVFEHDAPTSRGDSGGPVFGREGQLLGINVKGSTWALYWRAKPVWWHHRAVCHQPDPVWLKELMEKDRRARRQGAKPHGVSKS
jgi:S1-C subfamily serine protease